MSENPALNSYKLLLRLTSIIANADDFKQLFSTAIKEICEHTGSCMAEAWFHRPSIEGVVLHDVYVPQREKESVRDFYGYTIENSYIKRDGLPGHVWNKGKAEWVSEVYDEPYFFRREYARKSNIHTAFAVPISSDGQVKAVMAFYRHSTDTIDTELMEMLTVIAQQLQNKLISDLIANQLNETELRFWNIFNSSPDAMVIANQAGYVVFANPGTEAMFGYKPDELLGKSLQVLMPEDYREAHQKGLERYTKTGEMRAMNHMLDLEGIRKDNTVFPLELSLATWKSNNSRYYSGIMRDRTQSKKDKDRLQEKIRDLDNIIYRLSHDLRGPLTTIKGIAYHAQMDVADNQALDYFRLVVKSSEILDKKLKELSIIADISQDTVSYEPENLQSLIFNIVNNNKGLPEASGIKFIIDTQLSQPVITDKKLLYHILDKLIQNAVKYRLQNKNDYVRVSASLSENKIVLTVDDNGRGIEAKQLDRVFDLFYRANDTTDGTGIGLFIVKQALEKLNGEIYMESAVNTGTTVTLTLPLWEKSQASTH